MRIFQNMQFLLSLTIQEIAMNDQTFNFDFLDRERINFLLKQGYNGFTIEKVTTDDRTHKIVIEASNPQGKILTSKGETLEEAARRLIDLIDTLTDDL